MCFLSNRQMPFPLFPLLYQGYADWQQSGNPSQAQPDPSESPSTSTHAGQAQCGSGSGGYFILQTPEYPDPSTTISIRYHYASDA